MSLDTYDIAEAIERAVKYNSNEQLNTIKLADYVKAVLDEDKYKTELTQFTDNTETAKLINTLLYYTKILIDEIIWQN